MVSIYPSNISGRGPLERLIDKKQKTSLGAMSLLISDVIGPHYSIVFQLGWSPFADLNSE
jgi:hypothetical protein